MIQMSYKYDTNMLQIWYKYVTNMLQIWYKYVTNMIQIWYKYDRIMTETHFLAGQEKLVTAPFVAETTCRDPAVPQSRVVLQIFLVKLLH